MVKLVGNKIQMGRNGITMEKNEKAKWVNKLRNLCKKKGRASGTNWMGKKGGIYGKNGMEGNRVQIRGNKSVNGASQIGGGADRSEMRVT